MSSLRHGGERGLDALPRVRTRPLASANQQRQGGRPAIGHAPGCGSQLRAYDSACHSQCCLCLV
eukprot:1170989-Prymnesium_polylepis.2